MVVVVVGASVVVVVGASVLVVVGANVVVVVVVGASVVVVGATVVVVVGATVVVVVGGTVVIGSSNASPLIIEGVSIRMTSPEFKHSSHVVVESIVNTGIAAEEDPSTSPKIEPSFPFKPMIRALKP